MLTVKAGRQLIELIKLCYHANRPPLLIGKHGIGKSELFAQAAIDLGIGYCCRDLSLMEPPDLVGLPKLEGTTTRYLPPAFLPVEGEGVLVFEELNRCAPYMRAPCLQLLTARCLNDYQLPPGWLPCAAINPSDDGNYDVQELDAALLSRFTRVFVIADREVRPTYARPSRRWPDLVGIIPGQARQARKPKILAVIDTSASITGELLTLIDRKLRHLAKNNEVLVVECDCRIGGVYAYDRRHGLRDVQGRGGTDLRPPFEEDFLRQHQPDLVVYLTDGCGPTPTYKPSIPVIWYLVPGGQIPTVWGRIIHMAAPKVRKNEGAAPKNRHQWTKNRLECTVFCSNSREKSVQMRRFFAPETMRDRTIEHQWIADQRHRLLGGATWR